VCHPQGVRLTPLLSLAGVALVGCGGSSTHSASTQTAASAPEVVIAHGSHRRRHRPRAPGTLPQTRQLPSSGTEALRVEMNSFWEGVRTGTPLLAMPAFFPERAYAQVKAIADPAADYADRLLAGYRVDILAAHALLGSRAGAARLVRVEVPTAYAHWVEPGTCYNRVGYWEVPNSRVVYSVGSGLRSFGIASMISWRGVWYIVHLGAVARSGSGGVVDDPSAGAGVSAPSSTC
jgi:hypothetical protein